MTVATKKISSSMEDLEEESEKEADRKIRNQKIIEDLRDQQEQIGNQIRKAVKNEGKRRHRRKVAM